MAIHPHRSAEHIRCDRQLIASESIVWLEGDVNYTRIHLQDQPVKLSARTLKWYEDRLNGFIRIRRDAVINPALIQRIHRIPNRPDRTLIVLSNGTQLEIARRRQEEVRHQLKWFTLS